MLSLYAFSKQSYDLDEFQKVPTFKKPHVAYYLLPGGLQYLEVRPPGMRVPHHYVQSLQYNVSLYVSINY